MGNARLGVFVSVLLGAQFLIAPGMAIAAPASAAAAPPGALATSTSCVASWTQQPVSALGTDDYLSSISGTSPTSLYATGGYSAGPGVDYQGRVLRNAGSGWSDVSLPDLGTGLVSMDSSLSPTTDAAWVGAHTNADNSFQAALLHVVGSTATRVALPAPPVGYSELEIDPGLSLASSGGTDLWVGAGYQAVDGSGTASRVYHATGSGTWTTITVPSTFVGAVAAISPSVAYVGGSGLFHVSSGVVSAVPLPGDPAYVNDVVANGADDIWTLGQTSAEVQIIDHFDGTTWTSVPLPDVVATNRLDTIALAPNGVLWADGDTTSPTSLEGESDLARYDPTSGTWAFTTATVATAEGNIVIGSAAGLLALGNGNVYVSGYQDTPVPVIARLCQLPASLTGGATVVASRTLGDGVLVTSPLTTHGSATVTDTTGLLSTGPLNPGQGAALSGSVAATYNLRSSAGGGRATFGVPPISSYYHFKTTVLVAEQPAPAGYVYKLQMRTPGSTVWKAVFLSPASNFTAKYLYSVDYPAGNYLLRAQVQRLATSTAPAVSSGWSPPVTAVVVAK